MTPTPPSSPAAPAGTSVPLLTPETRRFPGDRVWDLKELASELLADWDRFSAAGRDDPQANPVFRLALEIGRRLQDGRLDWNGLEQLIQFLTVNGFRDRARRLGHMLGECDPAANEARIAELFERWIQKLGSFEAVQKAFASDLYGLVLTAHPTFLLSQELMQDLTRLATGRGDDGTPLDETTKAALLDRVASVPHRPGEPLTLAWEQSLALAGIDQLHAALRRTYEIALTVARQRFPDRWTELTPRLLTIASWVGYDLDGRSDISWADMIQKRLIVQARQLRGLSGRIAELRALATTDGEAGTTLELIQARLQLATQSADEEIAVFTRANPDDAEGIAEIQRLSRRMHDGIGSRLTNVDPLVALVERALRGAGGELQLGLVALRAELLNYGLGSAHTHVRINATQLHNAIRKSVGLETEPNDPRNRQSYLRAVEDLITNVEPVTISFGSVAGERTSAKRLFMVIAQMLKYIDGTVPVRFLIAECESAFTLLTALYYARLFGIEDKVEICPLFETETALHQGSRVIEQLLELPSFRKYLKRTGKLCIQTGYSDAGRYLGQTPASGSIERLKERIFKLFERSELDGVQLVLFDTHGESIGRGGHPGTIRDRLDYSCPPRVRRAVASAEVSLKQETSWQGGDGYLFFQTGPAALAVTTRVLEWLIEPTPAAEDDPYYEDRDWATEFLTTVKEFQVSLMNDPDYGALLTTWGANLLYQTGSRATKREGESAEAGRAMASLLRAIPHNAVLLQLGLPANAIGGVGEAIARDPAQFREMYQSSQRFRHMLGIVEYGAAVAEPLALNAYVETLDPGLWIARATQADDPHRAAALRRIAEILGEWEIHPHQAKIGRKLSNDAAMLTRSLGELPDRANPIPPRTRVALALLHAVRIALINEIFLLATEIPEFSSRHDVANQRILRRVLQLDVPGAVAALKRIFPASGDANGGGDYGERATYVSDEGQNYVRENVAIFEPMLSLHELVRRCSSAIAHRIGFVG